MKILIMGLPGVGKTTLARELAPLLNAVVFDADEIRNHINRDLGFSIEDRIEQARRMGWLCDQVTRARIHVIASFVCPIPACRAAFGDCFTIWINRLQEGPYIDTNDLFVPPVVLDLCLTRGSATDWALLIYDQIVKIKQNH